MSPVARRVALPLGLILTCAQASTAASVGQRLSALWQRAETQLDLEQPAAAVRTARRAIRLAPRNADAWALLSLVQFETARDLDYTTMDIADAANHAGRLGGSSKVWYVCGQCNCFCGPETEQGIEDLRHSLRLNPHYARAHAMLGEALWDARRGGEAVAEMRQAARLEPNRSRWHLSLCRMLGETNHPDEALAENDQALRLAATNLQLSYAHRERAWLLAYQGRGPEAVEQARLGCALLPDDLRARMNAAAAALRGYRNSPIDNWRQKDALATFGAITALCGDFRKAEGILGQTWENYRCEFVPGARTYVLAQLDRPDEARRCLSPQEAWRKYPQSLVELHFLGKAYRALGDTSRAAAACEVGVRFWPDHPFSAEMRAYLAEHSARH